jgi:hypothetical protein
MSEVSRTETKELGLFANLVVGNYWKSSASSVHALMVHFRNLSTLDADTKKRFHAKVLGYRQQLILRDQLISAGRNITSAALAVLALLSFLIGFRLPSLLGLPVDYTIEINFSAILIFLLALLVYTACFLLFILPAFSKSTPRECHSRGTLPYHLPI